MALYRRQSKANDRIYQRCPAACGIVELWHVWLTDYYEYEDRPVIHRQTVSVDELTAKRIREIDEAEIWNTPDKRYPDRPSSIAWK